MDRTKAREWLGGRHRGVLATLKRDGRPQLSNVMYGMDGDDILVSVTADRAKTRNLARDPRVSLHVTTKDFWSYVVAEGKATLTPPAARIDDDVTDQLVMLYRKIAGEHPDWTEFRQAMVDERRLVLRFTVEHLYGLP